MTVDTIADFLTRIRNAQGARRESTTTPYSKTNHRIGEVMKKNGFLADVQVDKSGKFPQLILTFNEKKLELKRVSKCGQRIYTKSDDLRKVKNGFGIAVVSTSKGIMTGYEARSKNVGGELLCEIS